MLKLRKTNIPLLHRRSVAIKAILVSFCKVVYSWNSLNDLVIYYIMPVLFSLFFIIPVLTIHSVKAHEWICPCILYMSMHAQVWRPAQVLCCSVAVWKFDLPVAWFCWNWWKDQRSQDSVVLRVLGCGFNSCLEVSRPALPSTQPPVIQCVTEALSWGIKQPWHEVDHHLHLMPRLRMNGGIPVLSHMPSWHVQRQLALYFTDKKVRNGMWVIP